jgi:hypothetical protein
MPPSFACSSTHTSIMLVTLTVDGWCVFCQFFFFLLVSQALNKNKIHPHQQKLQLHALRPDRVLTPKLQAALWFSPKCIRCLVPGHGGAVSLNIL